MTSVPKVDSQVALAPPAESHCGAASVSMSAENLLPAKPTTPAYAGTRPAIHLPASQLLQRRSLLEESAPHRVQHFHPSASRPQRNLSLAAGGEAPSPNRPDVHSFPQA